jgi:hypothetical protein
MKNDGKLRIVIIGLMLLPLSCFRSSFAQQRQAVANQPAVSTTQTNKQKVKRTKKKSKKNPGRSSQGQSEVKKESCEMPTNKEPLFCSK